MKNLIHKFSIAILCITIQSCETDIPETDNTAPEFSFKITGDGFDHTFTQDDDLENIQLNLKDDAEYDFILISSDNGGIKSTQWQLPGSDSIEFDTTIPSPWTVTNISLLNKIIEWEGDTNNPLTGNILTGTFESNGENLSVAFRFSVSDFGGISGDSNTISNELNIYIGNHNTEVINL